MPQKIFISYRREDTRSDAARLRDRLVRVFGKSNVFMDVDNLLVGQRFDLELAKALSETDVFLAVIGPRWQETLAARAQAGGRDYVRQEIAEAIQRGLIVIPVVIERTLLPADDWLPGDLRPLVLHQKHDISHERFGRDVDELVAAIKTARRARRGGLGSAGRRLAYAAGIVVALGAVGFGAAMGYRSLVGMDQQQIASAVPIAAKVTTSADAERAADQRKLADQARAREAQQAADQQRHVAIKADEDRRAAEAVAKRKAEEAPRRSQPGATFRDCDRICPEMVVMPMGEFLMGSSEEEIAVLKRDYSQYVATEWFDAEGPQRKVTIAYRFAVAKFEATFDEWEACVAEKACRHRPDGDGQGRGRRPVVNVNWSQISEEYLPWLSRKAGKSYRLLTEAEWEFAARAGSMTRYSTGPTITAAQANFNGLHGAGAGGRFQGKPMPVGSYPANRFGLHDMEGNVREVVQDCYAKTYRGAPTDGSAHLQGDCSWQMVRGGFWNDGFWNMRTAGRYMPARHSGGRNGIPYHENDVGFRVARTLDP